MKLSEKVSWGAARYSTEHQKSISNRPLRCRVVLHRAPSPYPQSLRTPKATLPAREILVAAIFYIVRSGCPWRLLAHDFPPWKTIQIVCTQMAKRLVRAFR